MCYRELVVIVLFFWDLDMALSVYSDHLSTLAFYDRAGRSVNDVITGYVSLDSSDNGALPGRSTTTA